MLVLSSLVAELPTKDVLPPMSTVESLAKKAPVARKKWATVSTVRSFRAPHGMTTSEACSIVFLGADGRMGQTPVKLHD